MYRSKRRWIFRILFVLFACSVLLGLCNYFLSTYTVRQVYVEGNFHHTQEEVEKIIMKGPWGNNALYLSLKYKKGSVKNVPFVDEMTVEILAPDTIKITVYEKALAGYIRFMDTNMYFDKDGYLVENSSIRTYGVPQITGLSFDHAVLGEPLPVEDEGIFEEILSITNLLNKYGLVADKIHFQKDGSAVLYFGEIKVALGHEKSKMEDKIMLLPEQEQSNRKGFLKELEGKRGTLQMETYDERGKYIFKPENF